MYPAKIEQYLRPTTIDEALAAIGDNEDGDNIFIAGGQSLMQAIKSRIVRPTCVVDLQSIAELEGISISDDVVIGPMTRYADIARHSFPNSVAALSDAAARVGDRQVRNRGTIGGSLCWNYVASCMPAVVLALDGQLELRTAGDNSRTCTADNFLLGPLDTDRAENEMLVSIRFANPNNTGSAYKKWGLVTDALPVVGICVQVTIDGDRCSSARIAFSGLANGAERCTAAEEILANADLGVATINKALDAAVETMETHDDQWADAQYRQQLIRTLGTEMITTAWQRAQQ